MGNLFTTLAPVEPEAVASLGFSWVVKYPHQVRHLFQQAKHEDIGILGAATGGASLGTCEDSPFAEFGAGSP